MKQINHAAVRDFREIRWSKSNQLNSRIYSCVRRAARGLCAGGRWALQFDRGHGQINWRCLASPASQR